MRRRIAGYLIGANLLGAGIASLLASVVVPGPDMWFADGYQTTNSVTIPVYAVVVGSLIGTIGGRRAENALKWVFDGRSPTRKERTDTLAIPLMLAVLQAAMWGGAVVVLSTVNGLVDPESIPKVGISIALGGAVTCTFSFLLAEFALRPVAAAALRETSGHRPRSGGVKGRLLLTWNLCSAVPVLGVMSVALASRMGTPATAAEFERAIVAFGSIALLLGGFSLYLAVTAATDPIVSLRSALRRVEKGEGGVRVEVFDGTEIGELQSGFNAMAAGLDERERIREVFGLQVGREVAELALSSDPVLGGEERDVAVLFVDVVGSTELAASLPPTRVVDLLNGFFQVVVDEVDAHGGIVDKFEGDAALAVFGAPAQLDDPYDAVLEAAASMAAALRSRVPDIRASIGVSSGIVVAGNVGARTRFEYTVIGDPVNEAARLSDHAKGVPGRTVASGSTLANASEGVAAGWTVVDAVVLRGRSHVTDIAVPASTSGFDHSRNGS